MTAPGDAIARALSLAKNERVGLWPEGGSVHYRSPAPISPDLRTAIVENKAALMARLAVWDGPEALRLMDAADGAVEASGVPGLEPGVHELAAKSVEAHHAHDMPGVRRACALIENRARRLAASRSAA